MEELEFSAEVGERLRARVVDILAELPDVPRQTMETLQMTSPSGTAGGYWFVALLGLVYLAVGYGALYCVQQWAKKQFAPLFSSAPETRSDKIAFLWFRGFMQAVSVLVMLIVASLVTFAVNGEANPVAITQLVIILTASSILFTHYVFYNLSGLDVPAYRMMPMPDAEAKAFYKDFTYLITFALLISFACMWMYELNLNHDAHVVLLIGGTLIITIAATALIAYRAKPISSFIRSLGKDGKAGTFLIVVSRLWHVVLIAYFWVAWVRSSVSLLLDLPTSIFVGLTPLVWGYAALAVYGLLLMVIDKVADNFARRKLMRMEQNEEGEEEGVPFEPPHSVRRLFEKAALLFVVFNWLVFNISSWGVDLMAETSFIVEFFDVLLVLFLAYIAYEAIKITIDNKIAEEGGYDEPEPGDEGGSSGTATRLATLLPMFRNALLITIVVIAGMILLSRVGVDVAPLFAGAGIVGLAVGFGAQALVRDIFSGAFFLVDDAFRKGEYIDLGGVKGTVERISIRSLQLRHHLGALHTIPFGEIQHLTNFSRDWVMTKLPLRVTYDTDVEHVRKLIKKLGKELMKDEVIGPSFIQPLKSQGVYKMEDSAMILRVKFMTKPGEQFVVRKQVYAKIRDLFEKEGIKFAHREVTVRLAGEDGHIIDPDNISEKDKKAIAGASLPPDENTGIGRNDPSGGM